MSAIALLDTRTATREQWLAVRKTGIGSSDAAAIAGLNPYRSALATYYEKRGEVPDQEQNEAMEWGVRLEPIIATAFAERTGYRVRRRNAILRHPAYTWAMANLDRVVVDDSKLPGVLEIKNMSEWTSDVWQGEGLPEMYAIQVHHQLLVTGYSYGYLTALVGGNRLVWRRIERDEEIIQSLIEIERDFWEGHVLPGVPPAPDSSESTTEALKAVFGIREPGKRIALPPSVQKAREEYIAAREAEAAAKDRKAFAGNQIRAALEDAEAATVGDQVVVKVTAKGALIVK